MKTLLSLLALSFSLASFAQAVPLPDFKYALTDIAAKGLKKETLFSRMNRDLIRTGDSICSNRAHVWAWDFQRHYELDTGKIFMFYTKKSGDLGRITWWYHVAPVIAENGKTWVMDAGFSRVTSPLTPADWLKTFAKSTNCKELKASETDLIELIFDGQTFPETTSYGRYDCYYKLAPAGYWTPEMLAKGILGRDDEGRPIQFSRDEIDEDEVYSACVEAVTSPIGRVLGNGGKRCRKYLGM